MERRGLKGRLAHALPELVWFNDDLQEGLRRSRLLRWPVVRLASLHRRRLDDVLFVAVTGSSGKSTTKELIAAVLGSRLTGTKTSGNANAHLGVSGTLLRTSRKHDFSVLEFGTDRPGTIQGFADLVRPRIGVVTTVGLDHLRSFRTLDAITVEKGSLVRALPAEGVAVLNADDPNTLAMGDACDARVVTVGLHPEATFRAEDVRAAWPATLSFTLRHNGTAFPVRTSLYGRHWAQPVLAAIAVGVEAGVPVVDAVQAVEAVTSGRGRMQPVVTERGVTFLRDDVKAGLMTALPALDFMADADATRKVVVFGRIVHFEGDPQAAYAALAERALEVADEVIFTGPEARYAPEPNSARDRLRILPDARAAAEHLRATTRPGDLVLIKASARSHLERIVFAQTAEVDCWLSACGRRRGCEHCELLDLPSGPDEPLPARLLPRRPQPRDPVGLDEGDPHTA
jgi:UDP-N-acetylmuramoyl-tripeptide--D-alanyl-D-alanine ligase